MRDPADFTTRGYRALLRAFGARGYRASDFAGVVSGQRDLILRHDLDVSISAAVTIAEIEADEGVGGHYFVRVRSGLYNPFEPESHAALRRLSALGHRIGLHFDAALYDNVTDGADAVGSLDAAAERECAALEAMIGAPVTMISFHRPAPALRGHRDPVAGRAHAYEPRFFEEIGYCSDSRGGWHHGHPLDHPAVAEGRALQLLTHPVWWTGVPGATVTARLESFVAERAAALRTELAADIASFGARQSERPQSARGGKRAGGEQ